MNHPEDLTVEDVLEQLDEACTELVLVELQRDEFAAALATINALWQDLAGQLEFDMGSKLFACLSKCLAEAQTVVDGSWAPPVGRA